MRNKKVFEVFLEFASSKDKEVLEQKFHDYSREIAVENVEEVTKLRRTKLTSEKKIIVLFSRHLCIREDCIKDEVIASASR